MNFLKRLFSREVPADPASLLRGDGPREEVELDKLEAEYAPRYIAAATKMWAAKSDVERHEARAALKLLFAEMTRLGVGTKVVQSAHDPHHRDGQIFVMFMAKLAATEAVARGFALPPAMCFPELVNIFRDSTPPRDEKPRPPDPNKDHESTLRTIRPMAEQGDAEAQYKLGHMYQYGLGVPKDGAEALTWYRKAAEGGSAPAQRELGWAYERGQGVSRDFTEALKWYRKAAEQDDVGAQANLGFMYKVGRGIPFDHVEAFVWTSLAVAGGNMQALSERKKIGSWLTPAQVAEAERRIKEWRPK